ncbi:MAG: cob(I)yrinic acid a,c-diamide adenosyltransferase [Spirochaetales bacterium]|nr:cob(I)yrinic acid a,c-diamide adenosyltransferase [Spirochaetales bacterium]
MIDFESITTRGGDSGESSLYNGERRPKDDPLFDALGDLDELSSWLGCIKTRLSETDAAFVDTLQGYLITASGEIAAPRLSAQYKALVHIGSSHIEAVEKEQKAMMEDMIMPSAFVHPGLTRLGAEIDIARTVCRRCERKVVGLIRRGGLGHLDAVQRFLNRVSDYLYVLARKADTP